MNGLSGMPIVESYTKKFNRVFILFMRIIALYRNLCASVSLWFIIHRNLRFFICAICVICGFKLFPCKSFAVGDASKFAFVQLQYNGGNWNPRPNAGKRLMWELIKRTSIEARIDTITVRADDDNLFEYPFLYMSGDQEFPPLSDKEIGNLKLYLEFGGTLLIDDSIGKSDFGFDKSVRREIKRLFPNKVFESLRIRQLAELIDYNLRLNEDIAGGAYISAICKKKIDCN